MRFGCCVFFFKQKTAYEMLISDWSSGVCSSDLRLLCAVCVQICDALNRCYRTTIKLHIGAERFHCLGEWSRHQHKAGEILHPLPRRLDIGRKHFVMIRVGGINATMRLGEREGDWLCHYLAFRAFSIAAIRSSLLVASVRRSEERRVGKECVSTCSSRWSPYHSQKNKQQKRK